MYQSGLDKHTIYLHQLLEQSAAKYGGKTAIRGPGEDQITYAGLLERATLLANLLKSKGAQPGDRIGLLSGKCIDKVIGLFGIMMAGCAYVPVDPGAPAGRNAFIFNDCRVSFVLSSVNHLEELSTNMETDLSVIGDENGTSLILTKSNIDQQNDSSKFNKTGSALSYILYTSGSTGKPKGVVFAHQAALKFVTWCCNTFSPTSADIFSSIAPFHFDLSTHDIFVSIACGATLVLIDDKQAKQPATIAEIIATNNITICYTTPSILRLLVQFGKLDQHKCAHLRKVLFAGEVFPVKHLRNIKDCWPGVEFYNLYGPTETNVCTWFKIPDSIADNRTEPFPIGKPCPHYMIQLYETNSDSLASSGEGELCVSGDGIMEGYWNQENKAKEVFFESENGQLWYRTGDIVILDNEGQLVYKGRKDRMVKRRGYRVELGEIEHALFKHKHVQDAAVIALPDAENGVVIKAYIGWQQGVTPSFINIKQHCMKHLPAYMIPDKIIFMDELPKTSTNKMDYQALKALK